jgi:hypothetical protein
MTSVHLLFRDGTGNHKGYDCQELTNASLVNKLSIHIIRAYCVMEHSYNFILLNQQMSFLSICPAAKICTANIPLNNNHPVLK